MCLKDIRELITLSYIKEALIKIDFILYILE
jgi:hypothetical protein